jgi:hypothetical protein
VQHGEHEVGRERAQVGDLGAGRDDVRELLIGRSGPPSAIATDRDGDRVEAIAVDGIEHGAGAAKRDFVLRGGAAEENDEALTRHRARVYATGRARIPYLCTSA